jgi:hypothetical protein
LNIVPEEEGVMPEPTPALPTEGVGVGIGDPVAEYEEEELDWELEEMGLYQGTHLCSLASATTLLLLLIIGDVYRIILPTSDPILYRPAIFYAPLNLGRRSAAVDLAARPWNVLSFLS